MHKSYSMGGGVYVDPKYRVEAYMEFKESMSNAQTILKVHGFVYLESMNTTGETI